jgi:lysophospholipase L1-like esterase
VTATQWTDAWGAMMVPQSGATYTASTGLVTNAYVATGQTLREIVQTGPGGSAVKIKLSNWFGAQSITVSDVQVALRDPTVTAATDNSAINVATNHPVTFNNGSTSATILSGQDLESDAIQWTLPPNSTVAVSYYVGSGQLAAYSTAGAMPANTTYVAKGDNSTAASFAAISIMTPLPQVYLLEDLEVLAPSTTRNIVAFGDSITYGALSSSLVTKPYPAVLSGLINSSSNAWANVINAGISGDELLTNQGGYVPPGLSRFQHDVLDHPGVTDVVVLIGTNDLNRGTGFSATGDSNAESIIVGYQSLIKMTRAQNPSIKIHGGTITPFSSYSGGWASETARLIVNYWILNTPASNGGFDDVIDFSGAVESPVSLAAATAPASAVAAAASAASVAAAAVAAFTPADMASACMGDTGLHPDDQGYQVMGTLVYDVLYGLNVQPATACNSVPLAP